MLCVVRPPGNPGESSPLLLSSLLGGVLNGDTRTSEGVGVGARLGREPSVGFVCIAGDAFLGLGLSARLTGGGKERFFAGLGLRALALGLAPGTKL